VRAALKVICIAEFAELGQGKDVATVTITITNTNTVSFSVFIVVVVVAATATNVPGMNEAKCYKGLCKLIIFRKAATVAVCGS